MTTIDADIIAAAADVIAHYSPALADAFVKKPFSRVDTAYAFAGGFPRTADTDDVHPHALAVIEAAYVDQRARQDAVCRP